MVNDNYTSYGITVQGVLVKAISFCLSERRKGNHINNREIIVEGYHIHLTYRIQGDYYFVFFIDDIQE